MLCQCHNTLFVHESAKVGWPTKRSLSVSYSTQRLCTVPGLAGPQFLSIHLFSHCFPLCVCMHSISYLCLWLVIASICSYKYTTCPSTKHYSSAHRFILLTAFRQQHLSCNGLMWNMQSVLHSLNEPYQRSWSNPKAYKRLKNNVETPNGVPYQAHSYTYICVKQHTLWCLLYWAYVSQTQTFHLWRKF